MYLDNEGIALVKSGNYTRAIVYLNRLLTIDSNDKYALYNIGLALTNLGKPDEAGVYQERASQIPPPDYQGEFITTSAQSYGSRIVLLSAISKPPI